MRRNSIAPHSAGVMGLGRFCKEGVLKKKGQKGHVYYMKDTWPNNKLLLFPAWRSNMDMYFELTYLCLFQVIVLYLLAMLALLVSLYFLFYVIYSSNKGEQTSH